MEKRPKHVAIIMDGNGRWAQARGLPRVEGHRRGADAVQRTIEACIAMGVQVLTLYCLSSENWKRPKEELDFLMDLLRRYLIGERPSLMKNGVQLRVIGKREGLPPEVLQEMDRSLEISKDNKNLILCLAINYGSRLEILDAAKEMALDIQSGKLDPSQIDESSLQDRLYTAGLPDPDLLIRTSGEMRISNFLLWQISYSEIWITEKQWPEFGADELASAIIAYANRDRRFGGIAT